MRKLTKCRKPEARISGDVFAPNGSATHDEFVVEIVLGHSHPEVDEGAEHVFGHVVPGHGAEFGAVGVQHVGPNGVGSRQVCQLAAHQAERLLQAIRAADHPGYGKKRLGLASGARERFLPFRNLPQHRVEGRPEYPDLVVGDDVDPPGHIALGHRSGRAGEVHQRSGYPATKDDRRHYRHQNGRHAAQQQHHHGATLGGRINGRPLLELDVLGRRHQGQSFGQTLQYEPGGTGQTQRCLTFATLHEVHQHATVIVFPLTKTTLERLDPLQLGGVVLHEPAKRAQISLRLAVEAPVTVSTAL